MNTISRTIQDGTTYFMVMIQETSNLRFSDHMTLSLWMKVTDSRALSSDLFIITSR